MAIYCPANSTGYIGERQIVAASRTPFCDGARALLSEGLAVPSDALIMRHAGSAHDALKASVGVAAKLTVEDESRDGKPRFRPWRPHPKASPSMAGAAPMRETAPAGSYKRVCGDNPRAASSNGSRSRNWPTESLTPRKARQATG
jgi:hypothetical protein